MFAQVFKFGTPEGARRAWGTRHAGKPEFVHGERPREVGRQISYLNRHARERGFADMDQMASKDPRTFNQLASRWRMEHPVVAKEDGFAFVLKADIASADLVAAGMKNPEYGRGKRKRFVRART